MRRAVHIPLKAFPRQNKEVALLPGSGTNVPVVFVPQCLKTSYFNFRPYKLKMSPQTNYTIILDPSLWLTTSVRNSIVLPN